MEGFIRFFMRKSSASRVSLLFHECHIIKNSRKLKDLTSFLKNRNFSPGGVNQKTSWTYAVFNLQFSVHEPAPLLLCNLWKDTIE